MKMHVQKFCIARLGCAIFSLAFCCEISLSFCKHVTPTSVFYIISFLRISYNIFQISVELEFADFLYYCLYNSIILRVVGNNNEHFDKWLFFKLFVLLEMY